MTEIEKLKADIEVCLGRLNALHAAVHTLVRTIGMPPEVVAAKVIDAAQRVEADALASSIPQRMTDETQRVLNSLVWAVEHRLREIEAQAPPHSRHP